MLELALAIIEKLSLPAIVAIIIAYLLFDRRLRQGLNDLKDELRKGFRQELNKTEQGLRRELDGLKSEVKSLKSEIKDLRLNINNLGLKITGLERGVHNFSSTLLQLLRLKEVLTDGEIIALHGLLRTLYLTSSSKHYTREVAKRLWKLINKNLDDYTWQDTLEMIKIADILREEFLDTGKEEYIDYSIKLRMFAALVQGRLMKLGKGPKPEQLFPRSPQK